MAILMISAVSLAQPPLRGGMVGVPASDPAIRKVADAYVAAVIAGNARAVAAIYREDAVEMAPGKPPVRGRSAIERHFRSLFESPVRITAFTLEPSETTTAGDVAFDVGTYRQVITCGPNAPPVEDLGKYVVILKRSRETWQVACAIYNSDRAVPSAPSKTL